MATAIKMARTCDGLKRLIAAIAVAVVIIISSSSTCTGFEVYFPMSALKVNLPINEKSQSIFSKIPIGRFQVLAAANNSLATDYLYNLESNDLLRMNSSTGEVFMKNDYSKIKSKTKLLLTAIAKSNPTLNKIPIMSLELNPQAEEVFCDNLENMCFWSAAHYTVVEDTTSVRPANFVPVEVGTLNPRGSKYICALTELKYVLESGDAFFKLKDNKIYTKVPLDHESLNTAPSGSISVLVKCTIKIQTNSTVQFRRRLNITVVDRNDNGPRLQDDKIYHFELLDPHFKALSIMVKGQRRDARWPELLNKRFGSTQPAFFVPPNYSNDSIGDKILFVDKDSIETNSHLAYQIYNDTNDIVRPICNAYEMDHTGKRNSVISCQLVFRRSGILSQTKYCFMLEASDKTVVANALKSAKAIICLYTALDKIHEVDRPRAMALRVRPHRKLANIANSEESLLNLESVSYGRTITQSFLSTYPKDVYVYRTAMAYNRVAQPENFLELMNKPELHSLRFTIVEDRTDAFGITPIAGIVYVKNASALERSLETVYFLNITWYDTHQRSFVINVHLVSGRPDNTVCDFKLRSRSQTCAQVKYQKQCLKFCGLATNGSSCEWRGSNTFFFSRNFATCVPNALYCPDNVCDPLEELNNFACPQDCTAAVKIMGPHSSNDNKRGILSASGTCTCEDNGKCSCAPMDEDEPKPKRKRKNELSTENVGKLTILATPSEVIADELSINLGGFECGKSCMIIAITCPLVFVMLLVCLVVSRRNLKQRALGKEAHAAQNDAIPNDCDIRNSDLPLIHLENGFKFDSSDSKWEFSRQQLVLDELLGEGEFGKVVKAYATDISGIQGVITVAVKMLKNGANSVEYMALLSEFELLKEVSHPNVIKLLGACTQGDSPLIIIEYARYGALRNYLRLSRKIECSGVDYTDGVEPVTAKNMLSFAWQICKGMAYLTEIKLVHRDLAARNVLLADGKICKISDFGLTRDVYEDDAYLKRSRDRVPVKWMAPESLADHVYTTKSDVWACGVLCWELITLGASPYPGIPPQNLYHLLKTGYRMERPENCSEDVYSIVRSCWTDDPNMRPSFKYLASQFEQLLGNNAKYIELEANAISNPSYCSDEAHELIAGSKTDLSKLAHFLGEPECLDHLWQLPKMGSDSQDCPGSREISASFSAEFQPSPGYDIPRPVIYATSTKQVRRYENDLHFPLNISKSVRTASVTSDSQNGSKCSTEHYTMPIKRGRSYIDMTNKTLIPDNLNNADFQKYFSRTISFRFSSLVNLSEQDDVV